MFTLVALLSLSAPPDYSTVPVPRWASVSIPKPKFGDTEPSKTVSPDTGKPKAMPAEAAKVVKSGAYVDPPGTHRHRCDYDGTIWSHATGGSHNCPTCGRLQYYHYTGPNPPTYTR